MGSRNHEFPLLKRTFVQHAWVIVSKRHAFEVALEVLKGYDEVRQEHIKVNSVVTYSDWLSKRHAFSNSPRVLHHGRSTCAEMWTQHGPKSSSLSAASDKRL